MNAQRVKLSLNVYDVNEATAVAGVPRRRGSQPEEVRKMPIYEYECRTCQLRFERLARPTATCPDTKTFCPKCHGENVQQLVSLFALSSDGTRQKNLQHGRKLAQKDQTEKQRADIEETQHHHDH